MESHKPRTPECGFEAAQECNTSNFSETELGATGARCFAFTGTSPTFSVRFISEDEMLAFWYHLVWGTKKVHDESEKFGYPLERFSAEGTPLTASQKRKISCWLQGFFEGTRRALFSISRQRRNGQGQ